MLFECGLHVAALLPGNIVSGRRMAVSTVPERHDASAEGDRGVRAVQSSEAGEWTHYIGVLPGHARAQPVTSLLKSTRKPSPERDPGTSRSISPTNLRNTKAHVPLYIPRGGHLKAAYT